MNTTQSIIVYRNPVEAAFWEGGYAFPLIASMVVLVVVLVALNAIGDRIFGRHGNRYKFWSWKGPSNMAVCIIVLIASVASGFTFGYLFY